MKNPSFSWNEIDWLIQELVNDQKHKVLKSGRHVVPTLTSEDVLQPNDYPELENHPYFRYEEGVLAGVQTVQMALWALKKQKTS